MLVPLTLPPGLKRNGTQAQAAGRWYAANLMRWFQSRLGPVPGWRKRLTGEAALSGKCRSIHPWRENNGTRWIGLGTETKLYAEAAGGTRSDITPVGFVAGLADATASTGFGAGPFGAGAFGTPRPDTGTVVEAASWSLDNFGQDLVGVCASDGKMYEWALNPAVKAAQISGSPTGMQCLVVSPEAFLVGAKGRSVIWSDQANDTTWTPATTNQAGDFDLATTGNILQMLTLESGFLILTQTDAWRASYLDQIYVYGFSRVGEGCGATSRHAAVSTDRTAAWMGKDGFYAFDGYVQPIPCEVSDDVFGNFNAKQASKVYGEHRSEFGEVWWYYPSASSTENNMAVVWSYRENHWNMHSLVRTAAVDRGVFGYPLATDASGYLLETEVGWAYGGATRYAETGPIRLGKGDYLMELQRIIPDDLTQGDITITAYAKQFPDDAELTFGPFVASQSKMDMLFQAGQARFRFTAAATGDFRIGEYRLDLIQGDALF